VEQASDVQNSVDFKPVCDAQNLVSAQPVCDVQNPVSTQPVCDAQNLVSAQPVCDAQATPKTHTTKKYQSKAGGSPVNPQRVKIGEFSSCLDNSNAYVLTTTNSADTICNIPPSRHIPAAIKNEVLKRDNYSCSYVDPLTKRRCSSQHGIEIDHKTPFSWQGMHTVSNLQVLCFQHNKWKGTKKIM